MESERELMKSALLEGLDYYYYYYYYYCCYIYLCELFPPDLVEGLSLESEWQQVSSGLQDFFFSMLTDLNNAEDCMVSILPLISNCSNLLSRPLWIVPSASTATGITTTNIFYFFFLFFGKVPIFIYIFVFFHFNSFISTVLKLKKVTLLKKTCRLN